MREILRPACPAPETRWFTRPLRRRSEVGDVAAAAAAALHR